MNKQSLGLVLMLFTLVLGACAQQKKTTVAKATATTSVTTASASADVAPKQSSKKVSKTPPAITYMSMERTACFGKCPSYVVEIYNNGIVRYTSRMFTEYEGVYEKNVGATQAQSLMSQYSQYRIDTCSDRYESYIQDLPGIIYVFKYGTTTKKIMNAEFGPEYLKKLSKQVDELAKVDETWKKVADKAKE